MRTLLVLLLLLPACRSKDDTGGETGLVTTETGDPTVTDFDQDGSPADQDCDDANADVYPGNSETPYNGLDDDCDDSTPDDDLDGDGHPLADDCDDNDPTVNPDAVEACNGVDDDCNDAIDDAVGDLWYADLDEDGYGDPSTETQDCEGATGFVADGTDCDDADPAVKPGATEVCNGTDDDCDLLTDDDDPTVADATTWYRDGDSDGYGDAATTVEACEAPSTYLADATDCDDTEAAINPGADEVCNDLDDDCDGTIDDDDDSLTDPATWWLDSDGDGYGSTAFSQESCDAPSGFADNSDDCDDSEASTWPGANEVCDEADNDCDTAVDENASDLGTWYLDTDGDGYGDPDATQASCEGSDTLVADATDCDDGDAEVHPGATELCNGEDDDCDGLVDDDDPDVADPATWYTDADSDGHGDASSPVSACEAPSTAVDDDTDCDDTDATVSPSATEICNGTDDDCDALVDDDDPDVTGTTTWYLDVDSDGYGNAAFSTDTCEAPSSYVADATDCDDAHADAHPGGTEVCDGLDNDCNGDTDDDDADVDTSTGGTWYADSDGDGYGDAGTPVAACDQPAATTTDDQDCDDADPAVNPAASETCSGVDDDCDGLVDDDDPADATTWYADNDSDGDGDPLNTATACTPGTGYVANADDCDDTDPAISTNATELCDGVDNDCDGTTDGPDAWDATSWYADSDGDGHGDATSSTLACDAPTGHVASDDDCDDTDPALSPSAAEECDDIDNDCDGAIDEDFVTGQTFYRDADGDGLGDPADSVVGCEAPSGYVDNADDCDDTGTDSDGDGLEDCMDDDRDGDGLANDLDADPDDASVVRVPTGGSGADGAWSVTTDTTVGDWTLLASDALGGDQTLETADTGLFAVDDELLVLCQQGVCAGSHAYVVVTAVSGTTVDFVPALGDDYSASDVVLVQRVPHYTTVDVASGVTVDADTWVGDGGAVLAFRATGAVTVDGDIDVSGQGFRGGDGPVGNGSDPTQGESISGTGASGDTSANDGGGGAYPRRGDNGDSGGGGGHGSAGQDGTSYGGSAVTSGGGTYGSADLSDLHLGSGGGGGSPDTEGDGSDSGNVCGDGGAGGGLIAIFSATSIDVAGAIRADGEDGEDAQSNEGEVGGGGAASGGTLHLAAPTMTLTGSVSATGGTGGASAWHDGSPYGSAYGGDGGDGRIRLDVDSLSGSTSPTAGHTQAYAD